MSHSGMVQSAGSSGGPANNQGGRNTQPTSKFPSLPPGHQPPHAPPPSNHNVPQHRSNPQTQAPVPLRPPVPAYQYTPRGPDMKPGPGHVANQGPHPHQATVVNHYGTTITGMHVPQINLGQQNQAMVAASRFVMMRGQSPAYNAASNIQARVPAPVSMPPNTGFVRPPMYTLPSSQSYSQNYFCTIGPNAQMAPNMTPPPMMNPSQPAQPPPLQRQSKAVKIVNPVTGEEIRGTRQGASGPPAPAPPMMVLPPTMAPMPMAVAGAPLVGPPPAVPPVFAGTSGMHPTVAVMEKEPPKPPVSGTEGVAESAPKRESSANRHSPAPPVGPAPAPLLPPLVATSPLVASPPPTKVSSPAPQVKLGAADTKVTGDTSKEASKGVAQEREAARTRATTMPAGRKAGSSPPPKAHEAGRSGRATGQPEKSNRGDIEASRGARGTNVPCAAPPAAAAQVPAATSPEAPTETVKEVPPPVPLAAVKVDAARPAALSAADEDEERRKVEERNEENLRKSQEATKRDGSQPAPAARETAPPVPPAAPDSPARPAAGATGAPPARPAPPSGAFSQLVSPAPAAGPKEEHKADLPKGGGRGEAKGAEPAKPDSPPPPEPAEDAKSVKPAASKTPPSEPLEEGEIVSEEGEPEPPAAPAPAAPAAAPAIAGPLGHLYKPGQWSPLCPDGKKQYDREFLLKLQHQPLSMNPPLEIPIFELFKEVSHRHTLPSIPGLTHASASLDGYTQRNGNFPLMAHFNGQRPGSGPMHRNKGSQMRGSADRTKKIITLSSSTSEDVKLHVAENAWKPVKDAQDSDSDEVLFRKFRGILNKLTPQNFTALVGQVKLLEINSEERLSNVTDLVLEKALNETHFASTYAKLCRTLLAEFSVSKKEADHTSMTVNFRKMLLQKCQQKFESDTDDSEATRRREKALQEERNKELEVCETGQQRKEKQEHFDDADYREKRRTLGLMRFIGELYNLGILNFCIMHDCFLKLMKNPTDEDSIVCACKLFTTIGRKLAEDSKTGSSQDSLRMKEKYNELMTKLKKIITENRDSQKASSGRHLPQRVIFMLEDVWELKTRQWIPRRDEQAPKTLDQIQQEAENEKILASFPQNPSGSGSGGGGGNRFNSIPNERNRRGTYGNQSQGAAPGGSYKQTKQIFEQVKLPTPNQIPFGLTRGGSMWGAGASGGGSRNSSLRGGSRQDNSDTSPSINSTNKFELLEIDMSDHPVRSQESSPPRVRDRERERDREAAIQGVRTLTQFGNNRAQSGPRSSAPTSRTSSQSGQTTPGTTYSLLGNNEDDEDQVKQYAETIFAEFLLNANKEDFLRDFCERVHKNNLEKFIAHFFDLAVERPGKIARFCEAIRELHNAHILSVRNFENVLKEQLACAEDVVIDIPKYYDYVADILSQLANEMDPARLIRTICDMLKKNSLKLLVQLFKRVKATCEDGVVAKWKKSSLVIPELVSGMSESDIKELEEALVDLGASSAGVGVADMTVSELTKKFDAAIAIQDVEERDRALEEIIRKAGEDHRVKALRACATAILHLGLKRDEMKNHKFDQKFVLDYFQKIPAPIKNLFTQDISINALYALQVVNHELQYPKDITSGFLNFVYDHDLVDDVTMLRWGDNSKTEPKHESIGYHVTVTHALPYLQWIREAPAEQEQNN